MTDITKNFGSLYYPQKAFVVYKDTKNHNIYVEAYDMGSDGTPINAHPLTVKESNALAKALDTTDELKRNFLKPAGLLPSNVLHIDTGHNGFALWHTRQQKISLLFSKALGINNGEAYIPPLVWKADKERLWIYAVKQGTKFDLETPLFYAPFFNSYEDGNVCMGTVAVNITPDCTLEEFIGLWQDYFFNSYFSHLIGGHSPVKGNIVQLWQDMVNTNKKFPLKILVKNNLTIKDLLK
jgi:PRTRC genetic system protein B